MSTDYGSDVQALDDLPDPEVLCSGDTNVAYALARRLAQDADAMEEIGDDSEYDAFNLEDYLGADIDLTDPTVIDEIQQKATQVLQQDPRALTVSVGVTYDGGVLSTSVRGEGSEGPFAFVLSVDGLSSAVLKLVQP